jgi:hypothetical protein
MTNATLQNESVLATTGHPLEPFARAWLARWTQFGASAYMGRIGEPGQPIEEAEVRMITSFPTYGFSPVCEDDDELTRQCGDLPEPVLRDRRSFNCHSYEGRVRELYAVLETVPGGFDAVQAVVELEPEAGCGRPLKEPKRIFGGVA